MNNKTAQSLARVREHPSSLHLVIAITDTHEEMLEHVARIDKNVATLTTNMDTLLDHFGLREHAADRRAAASAPHARADAR